MTQQFQTCAWQKTLSPLFATRHQTYKTTPAWWSLLPRTGAAFLSSVYQGCCKSLILCTFPSPIVHIIDSHMCLTRHEPISRTHEDLPFCWWHLLMHDSLSIATPWHALALRTSQRATIALMISHMWVWMGHSHNRDKQHTVATRMAKLVLFSDHCRQHSFFVAWVGIAGQKLNFDGIDFWFGEQWWSNRILLYGDCCTLMLIMWNQPGL